MGANREALETTLQVLGELHRVDERIDAASVQAARSLADILDDHCRNSQLWREYRELLVGLVGDDVDDGPLEELFEELRAPVRDQT